MELQVKWKNGWYLLFHLRFYKFMCLKWHRSPDGWCNHISITFNGLVDPISLLFTTCLWHAARAASFGSIHALRYTHHVPCECKTQASCCFVKNVRYANALAKWKNPAARVFRLLFWMAHIHLCERDCSTPRKRYVFRRRSMKCLNVLISWSTLREISFLSSAENIRESTMAIGIIIICFLRSFEVSWSIAL